MATVEALVTLEEFATMADEGARTELVQGRIIEVPPPGPRHGLFCFRFARLLGNFVFERQLGEVLTNDSGVITQRDPDSLRGADIAFYPAAKLADIESWDNYFNFPPDLVVEVRSPSDRWANVVLKALEYLAARVLVVVVLDFDTRSAYVYRDNQPPQVFGPNDTLALPDLLGDFNLRVGTIFE